jgi:serine/threonine protein kinase
MLPPNEHNPPYKVGVTKMDDVTQTLVPHGFLDVSLNEQMTNICDLIPRASEIARLGPEQEIAGESWRFLERSLAVPGTHVGWHIGALFKEGSYGKIYRAHRMIVSRRVDGRFDVTESPHECVVKQVAPPQGAKILPAEDVTAHTSEALLHVLAWRTIQVSATPWAVPRPYEVFGERYNGMPSPGWRSMSLCMSYVRGRTLFSYMQKYWGVGSIAENTKDFLEILAQIAYILHHLQSALRLNHRDVKVNNILIHRRKDPVMLELAGLQFETYFEVTLIDFGFACVGCPPPAQPLTAFQAGSWFPFGELCCKAGRDIAQLLYCIHCYYPFDTYLTARVAAAVHNWLQITWSGGVADGFHGFTQEGRPRRAGASGKPEYNTGIYEFLRRPEVDPVQCMPITIFRECHSLNMAGLN